MFAANALVVRTRQEDWEADETVGPLGQGYFIVRSRARVTRDGGQSLLAVDDDEGGGRLKKVSGRTTTSTVPTGRAPTAINGHAARGIDVGSSSTTTTAPPVQVPTVAQPSVPPPQGPPTAASAPATSSVAVNGTPQCIDMTGRFKRFAPFVRFISQYGSAGVKIVKIQQHFLERSPELYGRKLNKFKALAAEATSYGILMYNNANLNKPGVMLVPQATYKYQ